MAAKVIEAKGQPYVVCCENCANKLQANPTQYLKS